MRKRFSSEQSAPIALRALRASRPVPTHDEDGDSESSADHVDLEADDDIDVFLEDPLNADSDAYSDVQPLINRKRTKDIAPRSVDVKIDIPTEPTLQGFRNIQLGKDYHKQYPSNAISNAKYSAITFLPYSLFSQFKFFYNLYFLLVALSQAVPQLQIGFLSTYIVPLSFVLAFTLSKEIIDDLARRRRDGEINRVMYSVLGKDKLIRSQNLAVGHIVRIHKGERVPADIALLKTENGDGEAFIRTDQLDGETDWKLKVALEPTHRSATDDEILLMQDTYILAEAPHKSIYEFTGTLKIPNSSNSSIDSVPISVDNMLWANTVLASGTSVLGVVIFTGTETRARMNASTPRGKVGLLDNEINNLAKILCVLTLALSVILVLLHTPQTSTWYISILKFLILFSTIIPVSLRVNLDMGKTFYSRQIEHDVDIPETLVRTSTIPEELGRIEYLLADKTGTLTQNDMEMKKLHVGTVSYGHEAMDEVAHLVKDTEPAMNFPVGQRGRRELGERVRDVVTALAICHNVTPVQSVDDELEYQAASPDEIAIVKWTASVGLSLHKRDRHSLHIQHSNGTLSTYDILYVFPFTSERRRMGIIVRDEAEVEWFFEKGADTVMQNIVGTNDWLEEECNNMAREGLRTLVISRKKLSDQMFSRFQDRYKAASLSVSSRDKEMQKVVEQELEYGMELLGLTGVEDKLQENVKPSLELLRNAGVRIWMLTGDKVETAKCIAISSKLVSRGQYIHIIQKMSDLAVAKEQLDFLSGKTKFCLLLDGETLQLYLDHYKAEFLKIATQLPSVIACRCSPTQKADLALLIRSGTKKRVCCIGDGGNDVSMIQAADVGVGIVGKEGRQASLAADFSVIRFSYLTKLLLWHGRNSYKRSAKLAQFVIHRGLIIAVCQVVFSITSAFEPIALYTGWLMVGYATLYTMMPVFSLVLDKDVDEKLALLYPELYQELTNGKTLSYLTFVVWVLVSFFQGSSIMVLSDVLVGISDFPRLVAVSFTALIINELLMVALEIYNWHRYMIISEIFTLLAYVSTVPFLSDYFELSYLKTVDFYWKTCVVLSASIIPVALFRILHRRFNPQSYDKLQRV